VWRPGPALRQVSLRPAGATGRWPAGRLLVDGDLPSLLAAGEHAVFHGPPAAAVADLERAVVLAQRESRHAEVTAAVWLLGVALSAAGRYGGALRVLGPLLDGAEASQASPETRLFAAL